MKRFAAIAAFAAASLCASAQMPPSYQGLWWNAPGGSESGWGVNIAHQGNILFATWFTYDADGKAMWLVVPRAELQPGYGMDDPYYGMGSVTTYEYMGPIYRTSGPAFDAARFDASSVTVTQVGEAAFRFTGPNAGTFTYTVNGVFGDKSITRQVFSTMPTCDFSGAAASFQDLWWKAPANSESGWGINLAQEGSIIFATWFTYGADGKGMWLVASDVRQASANQWTGPLYSTSGPAFSSPSWDASKLKVSTVGSLTLTFDGMNSGTLTAVVNGATVTKAITRQVYASPTSACR